MRTYDARGRLVDDGMLDIWENEPEPGYVCEWSRNYGACAEPAVVVRRGHVGYPNWLCAAHDPRPKPKRAPLVYEGGYLTLPAVDGYSGICLPSPMGYTQAHQCDRCGGLVGDITRHDAWHLDVAKRYYLR